MERGWSLTDREGKTKKGPKKNRRRTTTGTDRASEKVSVGKKQRTKDGREEVLHTKLVTGDTLVK